MRDDIRRMGLFGSGIAELTRNRAEQLAKELLERSKQNRDDLLHLVRSEIRNQLSGLGLASKRDLERLERRVTRLEGGGTRASAARTTRSTSSTKKKKTATAKKSTRSQPASKTDATTDRS
jgi:polyhydroxyalkanoate synthesis regulator phasin